MMWKKRKLVQQEPLARKMMHEANQKSEDKKYDDKSKMRYQMFKRKFLSVTNVQNLTLVKIYRIVIWIFKNHVNKL